MLELWIAEEIMKSAENSGEDQRFSSVKQQVTKWLLAEEWKIQEGSGPEMAWLIVAEDSQRKKVVFGQLNKRPDLLLMEGSVLLPKEQTSQIKNMELGERQDLLWTIRFQLLNMRVKFAGVNDDSKRIRVNKRLYFEDLRRNEFVEAVGTVQDSLLAIIWTVQRKLGQPGQSDAEGEFVM